MALQLYYITDRKQFPGDGREQERRLLGKIAECAAAGVEMVQLREKDLELRALEELARKAMAALGGSQTRLLINSRTDVALACGAHGVHLPGNDLAASDVRAIFFKVTPFKVTPFQATAVAPVPATVQASPIPIIGVSAHSAAEVASAEAHGADFAVFAPVFEKVGAKDAMANREGLEQLRRACHRTERAQPPMPVLALGGITLENAQRCVEAGAAGIAAIRLFQQNDVTAVVKKLRESA
jgi:thiamine-phosphate pyrophosphorylase